MGPHDQHGTHEAKRGDAGDRRIGEAGHDSFRHCEQHRCRDGARQISKAADNDSHEAERQHIDPGLKFDRP